jgi:RNA polymerase sigma factor (sigma-70 family)
MEGGLAIHLVPPASQPCCAEKDEESPEQLVLNLYTQMRLPLLRHLMWMGFRGEFAEDIVQETFLRLHQQLIKRALSQKNLEGWVWKVAHNCGLNQLNEISQRKRRHVPEFEAVSQRLVDPRPNPLDRLERKEIEQRVNSSFRQLSSRERQCIHLRAQGMGCREIAAILGVSKSTIATTLGRVTTMMRRHGNS